MLFVLLRASRGCYSARVIDLTDYLGSWKPISKLAGVSWLVVYLFFLIYAALDQSGFLFLDYANLMIHEAGHPLFSPFGYTMTILGGTLAELIVPLACFIYFFVKRETTGVAFCAFWFFENFLYIGTYMADARTLALPLVGSGDHDWEILFTQWDLLVHSEQIGHATRFLGWLGMLSALAWLAFRTWRSAQESVAQRD